MRPDTVVVLRDLFKANINLPKFCQSYAVPQKTLDTIPAEVSAGIFTGQPSADIEGKAFKLLAERLGIPEPDAYEAQANDWASLVILTVAKAKEATGTALKDNVRKISQGAGQKVYSAVEGLKLLGEGKEINYEGASGPCDFTDIGDIQGCRFRYMEVVDGKLKFLEGGLTPGATHPTRHPGRADRREPGLSRQAPSISMAVRSRIASAALGLPG